MITAVVPTRDRPLNLIDAVRSICTQTRLPDELIIVDQSASDESFQIVSKLTSEIIAIKLIYIHDPAIKGLVDAKRIAVEHASGEIIYFLEDDVILEPDYFEQIELAFYKKTKMLGCSGIITNPAARGRIYKLLFRIFHRGIFKDKRSDIYGNFSGREHSLIPSDKLSGGVSAWRREVFEDVPFDVLNGFHLFEDIDFSTRVHKRFGNVMYINPNARLEHLSSPINRDVEGVRQKRKITEYILYYKKRRGSEFVSFPFLLLLFGMFLDALTRSIINRSADPLLGFFLGLYQGFKKKVFLFNAKGERLT